ncbi:MAG: hypothetical protein ACREFE_17005, partial [Limisphaerales bacterium]
PAVVISRPLVPCEKQNAAASASVNGRRRRCVPVPFPPSLHLHFTSSVRQPLTEANCTINLSNHKLHRQSTVTAYTAGTLPASAAR